MSNIILLLIKVALLIIIPVSVAIPQVTEEVAITSTPNPLGSGARALGMGNAFIAMADDATAASWNPGGLMQLETPEISMVFSYTSRTENDTFFSHPESDGMNSMTTFDLNYFSVAYPFSIFEKNMIVSLNYQRLYDLERELKFNSHTFSDLLPGSPGTATLDITNSIRYKAEGGIKALSPAYAIEITENLSFGFALNFWTDIMGGRNGWKEELRSRGEGLFNGEPTASLLESSDEYDDFRGFNFNLGVLWNITEMITFGAVFKSPFEAEMDHSHVKHTRQEFPGLGPTFTSEAIFALEDEKELSLPLSYGAGLAFRFSDAFTVAFDVYRTEWGQYFFRHEDDSKTSPIDGRPRSESHIKATNQVHLGAEYLFISEKTIIPARAGIFYDPEPSEEGSPEDFYGISLGTGYIIGDVVIDAAYQYRWGTNADNKGIPDTEVDVDQHTFYMSVLYYF